MTKKSYFNGELGQRFGFRKYLGVGICSVALSAFFVTSGHTEQVKADTLDDASSASVSSTNDQSSEENLQPAKVVQTVKSPQESTTTTYQTTETVSAPKSDSVNNIVQNNDQSASDNTVSSANTANDKTIHGNIAVNSVNVNANQSAQNSNRNSVGNNQQSTNNISETKGSIANADQSNVAKQASERDSTQFDDVASKNTNSVVTNNSINITQSNSLNMAKYQSLVNKFTNLSVSKVQDLANQDDTYGISVKNGTVTARKTNQDSGSFLYSYEADVHIDDVSTVNGKTIYFMFNPMDGNKYTADYLDKTANFTTTATNGIDAKTLGQVSTFNGGYSYHIDNGTQSISTDLHFVFNWQEQADAHVLLNSVKNGGLYEISNSATSYSSSTTAINNDINIGVGDSFDETDKLINNYHSLYQGNSNLQRTVTIIPAQNKILQDNEQHSPVEVTNTRYWYRVDGKEYVEPNQFSLTTYVPLTQYLGNDFTLTISQAINPDLFDYYIGNEAVKGDNLDLKDYNHQNQEITEYLQRTLPQYAFADTHATSTISDKLIGTNIGSSVNYGGANVDPSRIHITVTDKGSSDKRLIKQIHVTVDGAHIKWGKLSNEAKVLMIGPRIITGTLKKFIPIAVPDDINSYEDDEAKIKKTGYYEGYELRDPELFKWLSQENGYSSLITSTPESGATPALDQSEFPNTPDFMEGAGYLANEYSRQHNNRFAEEPEYEPWKFDHTKIIASNTVPSNAVEVKDAHTTHSYKLDFVYVDATGHENDTDFSSLPVLNTQHIDSNHYNLKDTFDSFRNIDQEQKQGTDYAKIQHELYMQVYGGFTESDNYIPLNWEQLKNSNNDLASSFKFTESNANSIINDVGTVYIPLVHQIRKMDQNDDNHRVITRTVTINYPNEAPQTITQSATFTRDTYQDLVTGKIAKAGEWHLANGNSNFEAVSGRNIAGYTADKSAPALTVNQDSRPENIVINYNINDESFTIKYIDNNDKTTVISSQPITGKYNQQVNLTYTAPDHWVIVAGQNPPTNHIMTENNPDITVYIDHKLHDLPDDSESKKTITRKITIIDPNGQQDSASTTQSVTFTRKVQLDEVTNQKIYGDWDKNSDKFDAIKTPTFAGYAPSSQILEQTVTPNSNSTELKVTYSPTGQNTVINYIDKNGTTIGSHPISGKTDQQVTIDATQFVPEHWVLVPGQNTNVDYTFHADGNKPLSYLVAHKLDPRPDDQGRHVTITRKVVITHPDGTVDPASTTQSVTFIRDANYDEVLGKVVYGKWNKDTDKFASVTVPTIAGYVPSNNVPETIVSATDKDSEIDVTYIANGQRSYYQFVDDDYKVGLPDISQHHDFSGKTDQTVQLNITIPEHYVLQNGQTIPSNYKFKADNNNPIIIHLKHKWSPDTDSNLDNKRTISRTVNITNPDGKTTSEQQSVTFTRTATKDDVSGEIKYDPWSNKGQQELPSLTVPTIDGYTASGTIPSVQVTPDSHPDDVNISYTANPQSTYYQFIDDNRDADSPDISQKHTINGTTDHITNLNIIIPDGYKLKSGQTIPTNYTFHAQDNDPIIIHLEHGSQDVTDRHDIYDPDHDNKPIYDMTHSTVTRTIVVNPPHSNSSTTNQSFTFTRKATQDLVTKKITYTPWNENQHTFDKVAVPDVPGYNASSSVPAMTVKPFDSDSKITVTYHPLDVGAQIIYQDKTGKEIGHQDINGKTDQTVDLHYDQVPDHWIITSQNNPTTYTFKPNNNSNVVVTVDHKLDPRDNEDRTVERTVNVYYPNQPVQTTKQNVTFTRMVQYDEVDQKPVYGDWTVKSGNANFDAVSVNTPAGYAVNGSAGNETVTADTPNQTININFIANGQSSYYQFVDDNKNDKSPDISQHHAIAGRTDQTIDLNITVPTGFELAKGQTIPTNYTFKSDNNNPIVIHLIHGMRDTSNDNNLDTHRTISRNINETNPLTNKVTTITQSVDFVRGATQDVVTKEIHYGEWTEKQKTLPETQVDQFDGYTPNMNDVPALVVTADTGKVPDVNVIYTANNQSSSYHFVDDMNSGAQVGETIPISGKTNQTIHLSVSVPKHYALADGQTLPTSYTFRAKGNLPITIHLVHATHPATNDDGADLNHHVGRTIIVTTPNGKTTTTDQGVDFTRTGTYDEVTGKITYTPWDKTTDTLASYDINQVPGYTSQVDGKNGKTVTEVTVTPDSPTNQQVQVTYTANDQTSSYKFVDDMNNGAQVGNSIPITGKTGQTVSLSISVPDHYTLANGQTIPTSYTFKADNNLPITIHLVHATHPATKEDGADLDHHVGRTIIVTTPDGHTTTTEQSVDFTRTGTYDEVTGKIAYEPWNKSSDTLPSVDITQIPGYISQVNGTNSKTISEITVTPDSPTDQQVKVTYMVNNGKQTIIYVDDSHNGQQVGTQVITGKVTENISFKPNLPNGYKLAEDAPKTVTISDKDNPITLHVVPIITEVTITHDHPVEEGKLLPGTDLSAPYGVGKDNLNMTITRVIDVVDPVSGQVNTTVQKVVMYRDAKVNLITKMITYTPWQFDGTDEWAEFLAPNKDGYKANPEVIPETFVNEFTKNVKVVITYTKVETPKEDNNSYVDNGSSVTIPTTKPIIYDINGDVRLNEDDSQFVNVTEHKSSSVNGDAIPRLKNQRKRKAGYSFGNSNNGLNRIDYSTNSNFANNITTSATIVSASQVASRFAPSSASTNGSLNTNSDNANSGAKQLPQTGSKQNMAVIALGLATVSLGLGLATLKKRKN